MNIYKAIIPAEPQKFPALVYDNLGRPWTTPAPYKLWVSNLVTEMKTWPSLVIDYGPLVEIHETNIVKGSDIKNLPNFSVVCYDSDDVWIRNGDKWLSTFSEIVPLDYFENETVTVLRFGRGA